MLKELIATSFEGAYLQVRRYKLIISVIPSRL